MRSSEAPVPVPSFHEGNEFFWRCSRKINRSMLSTWQIFVYLCCSFRPSEVDQQSNKRRERDRGSHDSGQYKCDEMGHNSLLPTSHTARAVSPAARANIAKDSQVLVRSREDPPLSAWAWAESSATRTVIPSPIMAAAIFPRTRRNQRIESSPIPAISRTAETTKNRH